MLVAGMSWLHLESARFGEAISGILAMAGVLLLHQSFAELLERKAILRVVQFGLTGIVTLALIYFMVFPTQSQLPGAMLCATLGVLHALVAVLVFRFSDEEVGPVGWLTSLALAGYALILFLRAVARVDLSWSGYVAESGTCRPCMADGMPDYQRRHGFRFHVALNGKAAGGTVVEGAGG